MLDCKKLLGRQRFAFWAACVLVAAGCDRKPTSSAQPGAGTSPATAGGTGMFQEVTAARGLPSPAWDWPGGTFATPEVTPGGVALLDYDNDGRLDILQICHARPGRFTDPAPNRLFHQQPDGSF